MTLGLLAAGPIQMIFSLLLMQGLSLTMWRTFLNQAIPRFDPMKFSMTINNENRATPPSPANVDPQNLLPYLNLLMPIILQQHMLRHQQMMPTIQPSAQPQVMSAPVMSAPVMTAPAVQMPAPAFQMAVMNGQPMPQFIIMPQVIPQPMATPSTKGSASTNVPVQVEPPDEQNKIPQYLTKRMLERPPKTTTRRPKVVNRAYAGAIHIQFATPRAPAGYRRFIIPPVTVGLLPEEEVTPSPDSYRQFSNNFYNNHNYLTTYSTDSVPVITESGLSSGRYSSEVLTTTTSTPFSTENENPIEIEMSSVLTTTPIPDTTSTLISSASDNHMMTSTETTTQVSDKENIDFDILLNETNVENNETKVINNSTENVLTINDLIHKDFDEYVRNISLNQIESNQSPEIYFENSKGQDSTGTHTFKRVCYYLLKTKDGNLKISDIDPFICSHLIVGYASVSANDLIIPWDTSEDPEKYRELTHLKTINRKLKVMLSIGDGSGVHFSKMVSNDKSRDKFVASVLDVCDAFNFDGIDIDWEYPYFRTGSIEDKQNFVLLLKEIRREAIRRFRDDFIISATVGAPLVIAMSSYDIPLIGEAVDFVNLMSYDFNTYRWDRPYTGHHSPLYPRPTEKNYFQTLNAAWSATYWANKGMPLHKIILGVPTYARTYSLVVPVSQGLDVPVSGPGLGGGKLNYTAVCHFLFSGATREFDVYSQVPFAYKNFDWVAYESEISTALKAQWVVRANMGGVMTFALNFDDIKGECRRDGKRFPLQKAISNLLELSSIKAYRESSHSPPLTQYISKKQI